MPLSTRAVESRYCDKVPGSAFLQRRDALFSMDALSTIFFVLCLASYFSYFLPYSGMCPSCSFVCAAVICYSPASSTCSVFLCRLYPASSRNSFLFMLVWYVFVVLFSWVACYRARVPGTLALDLPTYLA